MEVCRDAGNQRLLASKALSLIAVTPWQHWPWLVARLAPLGSFFGERSEWLGRKHAVLLDRGLGQLVNGLFKLVGVSSLLGVLVLLQLLGLISRCTILRCVVRPSEIRSNFRLVRATVGKVKAPLHGFLLK